MTDHDGDDIAGQRLAALLNDVDPPGPDMEVGGLLVAGRRAARRHRTLLAGSTAGAVAVLLVAGVLIAAGPTAVKPTNPPATSPASNSPANASCRIQTLSAPVPLGQVFDMDPTGRYIVAGADDNRIVVWTDGIAAVYRVPDSGSIIAAVVNRDGVVAVGVQDGYPHPATRSWIKVGSTFTRLTPAEGWDGGTPRGIDSAGDVVTWAFNASGDKQAGVFYTPGQPHAPHVLPAAKGDGAAYGIGDTGIIAGNIADGAYAFYWDSHHHGHKPPIPPGYPHSKANATAGDWMVGYVADHSGQPVATRWNLATGKVDVLTGHGQAVDVDSAGDFTGNDAYDGSPYLYRAGNLINLPLPPSATNTQALALTEDGHTVLGSPQLNTPGVTAILWHC